jgi:hypothetical protein
MKKKRHNHKFYYTGKFIYLEYRSYQFHYEQRCKCGKKRLRKGKRKYYDGVNDIK